MTESWIVTPLKSIGPLRLGMSRSDVGQFSSLLGDVYAFDETKTPDGKISYRETRDLGSPIFIYQNGHVVDILVDHHSIFDVIFNKISVFKDPSLTLLRALEKEDGEAYWGFGAVVFPRLSIGTMGFMTDITADGRKILWENSEDKPPRILTLSEAHGYDEFLSEFYKKVSFLS